MTTTTHPNRNLRALAHHAQAMELAGIPDTSKARQAAFRELYRAAYADGFTAARVWDVMERARAEIR